MEKQRYIFDLDGTLLTCNYGSVEHDYFQSIFGDDSRSFTPYVGKLLDEYEKTFPNYDKKVLSGFLSRKTGLSFTPEIIAGWINIISDIEDTLEDGVGDVLEHLKKKDKSLVVLSNWFGESQIPRLKNAGIYDYFDEILTGEYQLKPHKSAYIIARGDFSPEQCIFIGDQLNKDYVGPRACGMESVLYDKKDEYNENMVKIKRMNEIIKKY